MSRSNRQILKELRKPKKPSVWERWGVKISILSTLLTVVFGVLTYNLTVKYGENREQLFQLSKIVQALNEEIKLAKFTRINDVIPRFETVVKSKLDEENDYLMINSHVVNFGGTAILKFIYCNTCPDTTSLPFRGMVQIGDTIDLMYPEIWFDTFYDPNYIFSIELDDIDGREYLLTFEKTYEKEKGFGAYGFHIEESVRILSMTRIPVSNADVKKN